MGGAADKEPSGWTSVGCPLRYGSGEMGSFSSEMGSFAWMNYLISFGGVEGYDLV